MIEVSEKTKCTVSPDTSACCNQRIEFLVIADIENISPTQGWSPKIAGPTGDLGQQFLPVLFPRSKLFHFFPTGDKHLLRPGNQSPDLISLQGLFIGVRLFVDRNTTGNEDRPGLLTGNSAFT